MHTEPMSAGSDNVKTVLYHKQVFISFVCCQLCLTRFLQQKMITQVEMYAKDVLQTTYWVRNKTCNNNQWANSEYNNYSVHS